MQGQNCTVIFVHLEHVVSNMLLGHPFQIGSFMVDAVAVRMISSTVFGILLMVANERPKQ